jgi:hypothetical protein
MIEFTSLPPPRLARRSGTKRVVRPMLKRITQEAHSTDISDSRNLCHHNSSDERCHESSRQSTSLFHVRPYVCTLTICFLVVLVVIPVFYHGILYCWQHQSMRQVQSRCIASVDAQLQEYGTIICTDLETSQNTTSVYCSRYGQILSPAYCCASVKLCVLCQRTLCLLMIRSV